MNMNFFLGRGVNFQVEAAPKETKKRRWSETMMNEHENENCVGLDLELKLAPPGSSVGNLPIALKSTNSKTLLSSSSNIVKLPSLLGIEENIGVTSKDELSTLIAMGCARCLLYVMVSKADPKCPNCKNFKLIDTFQVNPTKKMKIN